MNARYDYIVYDKNIDKIYACTADIDFMNSDSHNQDVQVSLSSYYQGVGNSSIFYINGKEVTSDQYKKYIENIIPLYSYKDYTLKHFMNTEIFDEVNRLPTDY